MANNYCDCRQGRDPCTCKSALADPVPPAGGEPEVVAVAYMNVTRPNNRGNVYDLDWYSAAERLPVGEYHLVDEAHVTRLQAEVEQAEHMRKFWAESAATLSNQVDALQSELTNALKHFETVVQDNKNLYEELTKAWELLRSVRLNANPALFSPGQVAAIDALLPAPAAKDGE